MLEVTEQRPMNEYVNSWISKLSSVALRLLYRSTFEIKNFETGHSMLPR